MLQALALKLGIGAAILAAVAAGTWGMADAHYSRQYERLKASYEAAAAIQREQVDRTIADNQAAAKAVNDEAQQQIGSMATAMADLSSRLQHAGSHPVRLCPAPAGTVRPYLDPIGPAVTAGDRPAPAAAEPDIGIARNVLVGALTIGIDSLKAQQFWRTYARRTKQAP